jgi:pimeloyl-ACP methyl ester carboxylesterase
VPELSKEHEVIVADSRGHGRSTRTDEPLSYHLLASDYVALLDLLDVDSVSVVGWSDGGIIGYDLAINYPDRVARLLTHGSNATPDGWNAGEIPQTAALTQSGEADVAAYKAMSSTPDQWEDFQAAVYEMWNTEPNFTTEQLASITAPTVIALAEHDEFIKRDHALYIAETIPGAFFVMMPDVSHLAIYQDPEIFLEVVQDFVD